MIKAIVRLEWRLRARRDQFRPLLSCYSTCLLLDCCALYIRLITSRDCIFLPPLPGRSGRFLSAATEFIWLQQWLLPFLLAPVLVANAFTGEKASGLLPLLFTTPVSSGQLILGKFLGRVGPLVMLGLAHWPFWGLFAGLVGLDPLSAGILAGASVLPILAAGSASLLASAWCAKTADAVTILYALFGVGILGTWVLDAASFSLGPAWNMVVESGLAPFGPHYLLESIGDDAVRLPELARRALVALAAWGSVVAGCLGLACRRVRSVSTAQPEIRQSQAALRRPAVDDEPIRWKECYRERRLPWTFLRYIPTWLALLGVFVGTVSLFLGSLWPSGQTWAELVESLWSDAQRSSPGWPECLAIFQGLGNLFLAALMVGVRCATSITGERERRTWELLLLTPLSTRELIHGKVEGIVRSAWPYVAVYALAAVPLSWLAGQGVLLATLVTLFLTGPVLSVAGAIGIYHSVRASDSWKSILDTVRFLVGGVLLTAFVSNFVLGCLGLAFMGLATLIKSLVIDLALWDWLGLKRGYLGWLGFLLVVGSLWTLFCCMVRQEYLAKAEKWVDELERNGCPESGEDAGSNQEAGRFGVP